MKVVLRMPDYQSWHNVCDEETIKRSLMILSHRPTPATRITYFQQNNTTGIEGMHVSNRVGAYAHSCCVVKYDTAMLKKYNKNICHKYYIYFFYLSRTNSLN
jgi:hypothetical protein